MNIADFPPVKVCIFECPPTGYHFGKGWLTAYTLLDCKVGDKVKFKLDVARSTTTKLYIIAKNKGKGIWELANKTF